MTWKIIKYIATWIIIAWIATWLVGAVGLGLAIIIGILLGIWYNIEKHREYQWERDWEKDHPPTWLEEAEDEWQEERDEKERKQLLEKSRLISREEPKKEAVNVKREKSKKSDNSSSILKGKTLRFCQDCGNQYDIHAPHYCEKR